MTRIKKMLAALLSVCIIGTALTFTGCAKEENTSVADNSSTAETEPEESEEEAETSSEEPEENDNIEETTKQTVRKPMAKKLLSVSKTATAGRREIQQFISLTELLQTIRVISFQTGKLPCL